MQRPARSERSLSVSDPDQLPAAVKDIQARAEAWLKAAGGGEAFNRMLDEWTKSRGSNLLK